MLSALRVFSQWQQRLKGAVENAQVTARAIVLHNSDHGLSHATHSAGTDIMLCLENALKVPTKAVKFIGPSHQPVTGGEEP
mgnify:FL=1